MAEAETLAPSYEQLAAVLLRPYYSFTASLCEILAQVEPTQAVPALITVLHGQFAQGDAPGDGGYERFLVAQCLLAAAFSQGEVRPDDVDTPFLLAHQPHINVIHRQARKVAHEEIIEVDATVEAAQALLAAVFSPEHPLSTAPWPDRAQQPSPRSSRPRSAHWWTRMPFGAVMGVVISRKSYSTGNGTPS